MKLTFSVIMVALAARHAAGHATFQDLWINGVDMGGQCVRQPPSNSPVTDVTSTDIRCNVNGLTGVSGKCAVKAGDTVTVEMHQQPGDRSCANQAIGGEHWGPILVYLTKVSDSSTADGSTGWFKIFQDGWAHNASGKSGDDDYWGTKDLNTCCGRMDVKIPTDIAAGDYLLRAEAIALHVASQAKGAQLYMSCYQLTISGGGSAAPSTVNFPGAYKASDPGILVDIHASMSTYVVPGPTVYASGTTKSAGSPCDSGCESTCTPGKGASGTAVSTAATATSTGTSTGSSGCSVAKYGQCGGSGYTGCTKCASGSTCQALNSYYSQCS